MSLEINLRSGLLMLSTILLIVCSGSQFGIDYARYLDVIFLVVVLTLFILGEDKLVKKNDFLVAIVLLIILWMNYFVHISDNANINAYISYSIRLIGSFYIVF